MDVECEIDPQNFFNYSYILNKLTSNKYILPIDAIHSLENFL